MLNMAKKRVMHQFHEDNNIYNPRCEWCDNDFKKNLENWKVL